ncbi:vitamin-D-receptor interacting mediator subunit 4-domain-containing protein [Xylariales sp. PMI_506]|nr:vitamin-D-receptor interacting mediator subunit 4-domain-containing protein [Xylariales sp. PMI_506]
MDRQISARFERIEKALANLIDSISKYNPSAYQGTELLVAETELSKGLEELQVHQQNHARIQRLRNTTNNLDGQIKETLTSLAQTRKELVATSATIFPDGPNYPIKYDELLAYARRISKTTLPTAAVLNSETNSNTQTSQAAPAASDALPKPDGGTETAATTPGSGTPNGVASAAGGATPAALNGALESSSQRTADTSLPEQLTVHLNPLANAEFIPWPTEDHVRQGALANLAYLNERGINPEGYDPAEEEARKKREEEEAKAREEQERQEREEKERRYREQAERARQEREKQREKEEGDAWRRGSVSQGGPSAGAGVAPPSAGAGEKKQFQFMGGDDDDDSD